MTSTKLDTLCGLIHSILTTTLYSRVVLFSFHNTDEEVEAQGFTFHHLGLRKGS